MSEFELPFPRKGLSDDKAKGRQEPGTTGDALNVRLIDPETGRSRGAQRAGLSKYLQSTIETAGNPVQDLAQTMRPIDHIQFVSLASTVPGNAQASAEGSYTIVDALNITDNDTSSPGDTITLDDGRVTVTFQWTSFIGSTSDAAFVGVLAVPSNGEQWNLESLGAVIDTSAVEIGWSIDTSVSPPVMNLVNARAGIDVAGNTAIVLTQTVSNTFTKVDFAGGAVAGTNTLGVEWEKRPPGGSTASDGFRDSENNLWTLSSNGVAVRYNPDGEVLETINVPVPSGFSLVEVLTEDASGNVYFASTQSTDTLGDDASSEIYRYKAIPAEEQDELPTYELDWTWATELGSIQQMLENAGVLYVLFRRQQIATAGAPFDESPAEIVGYSPLSSSSPIAAFEHLLETVPHDMTLLDDGSIAVSFEERVKATEIKGRGMARAVPEADLWTPWDLNNYRERLHFWVRAEDSQSSGIDSTHGDEIDDVPDHRASPPTGKSAPYDTTDRPLSKRPGERNGPVLDEDSFSRRAGIKFNATSSHGSADPVLLGEALVTLVSNSGNTAKTVVTDSLASQYTPFPSYPSNKYALCFIIRLDATDVTTSPISRILFSQDSLGNHTVTTPTATAHAFVTALRGKDYTAGGFDTPTGGEVHYHPGPYYENENQVGSVLLGDASGSGGKIPNWNTNAADTGQDRIAIVSIVKNSEAGVGVDVVRVNGRQVDVFTHQQDACNGGDFVLGCRRGSSDEDRGANGDLFHSGRTGSAGDITSFKGHIGEMITVLSDSSATSAPHDLNFDAPYAGIGAGSGGDEDLGYAPSGSVPAAAARTDADMASELERIEGYLAHKYGAATVLPYKIGTETEERSALYYYERHPFGGNGFYPKSPDATGDDTFRNRAWPSKVLLFSAGLKLIDAAWGSGFMHAGADTEGHIVTGGKDQMNGLDYRFADGDRAQFRRLSATAGGFRDWLHATGRIDITAVPAEGDTVTVNDGTTTVIFRFTAAPPVVGYTSVSISSLADSIELPEVREMMQRLIVELELAFPASIRTYAAGGTALSNSAFLVHDAAAFASNTTIAVSTGATGVAVSGFSGGSDVGDDWIIHSDETSQTLTSADDERVPINFDLDGNFYYPNRSQAGASDFHGRKAADGALFMIHAFDDDEEPREVIPLLNPPDFDEDAIEGVESLFVLTSRPATSSDSTVYRMQAATITELIDSGDYSTREAVYLGVAGGSIIKFTRDGSPAVVTGGASVLTSGSPYVQSTTLFGDVFFTDGVNAYVYKVDDDEVVKFKSSSAGAAPRRFRLCVGWRQRLVVARVPGDDFNWYMSKQGDPYNWNTSPVVINAGQAVTGSGRTEQLAGPGDSPDVINSLIPWSDDLLIFGGDRSIQRLTGDPMSGGQIDLVTESTGIAFGTPWARSPSGVLYFFGSRGGVWAMSGQRVQRLTTHSIERRMRDLQLDAFKLRLVWNYEDEGLHVIPVAYNLASTTVAKSWFLDVKHGGWWEDEWGSAAVMPTSAALFDGDAPDDRKVLFGCADGYVRFWDKDAMTDDGQRIQSHVRLGPLAPEVGSQYRFSKLTAVMSSGQGGVEFDAYVGEDPETLEHTGNGNLVPGRNAPRPERWNGPSSWVTLRSGGVKGWALESLAVTAHRTGRKRVT